MRKQRHSKVTSESEWLRYDVNPDSLALKIRNRRKRKNTRIRTDSAEAHLWSGQSSTPCNLKVWRNPGSERLEATARPFDGEDSWGHSWDRKKVDETGCAD